jgi:hypothetical protein
MMNRSSFVIAAPLDEGRAGARVTSLTEAHVSLGQRRPRLVAAGTSPYNLM